MTCHDARELLSSLLDDALGPAERAVLEAHVAACADCGRELEALRATVSLLGRLPAAHAPAGFVDRVVAATHRPPWPRRVLDALFVPLRVKLPLEAVAVLLVSVSAVYVYQQTPEVRELARQEPREAPPAPPVAPPPPSASSAAPEIAAKAPASKDRVAATKRPPAEPDAAPEQTRRPPLPATPLPPSTPIPGTGNLRDAPGAPPMAERQESKQKKEARVEEPADVRSDRAAAEWERLAKSNEPAASRDTVGSASRPGLPAPPPPPSAVPPASGPRGGEGGTAAAPPVATAHDRATADPLAVAKAPVARRLMRAVDASGRLVVPAREPAETALDTLLGRLGARRVERRLEGDRGMVVIDVLVPGVRYRELIEGLGQIGRWVTDHEPGTLPAQLRLEVALTVEP